MKLNLESLVENEYVPDMDDVQPPTPDELEELDREAEELEEEVEEAVTATEQLLEIRENIIEHGITPCMQSIYDEDEQMTNFLGISFEENNKDEILTRLDAYFENIDVESSTEVNAEDGKKSLVLFLGSILTGMVGKLLALLALPLLVAGSPILALIASALALTLVIAGIGAFIGSIVYAIMALVRSDVSTESYNLESMTSSTKAVKASDVKAKYIIVKSGVTMVLNDLSSEFKNYDIKKYESVMTKLSYTRRGDKFKGGSSLPITSGTLTELGWTADALNSLKSSIVSDGKAFSTGEAKIKTTAKSLKARVADLSKQVQAAKDSGKELSKEEKTAAKAKISQMKSDAKAASKACKLILKEYLSIVKLVTRMIKTANSK